jgi:hypothetical protein
MQIARPELLLATLVFFIGTIFGAGALRAWQQVKIFVANSRITMLDVRYEILQHATRRPAIVMLGDSITAGVPWRDAADCADISNYGMDGDTTEGIINRLREVLVLKPKAVFLMIGANDILKRHVVSETADNVRLIVNRLRADDITVYVHPVLPIDGVEHLVAETNRAITRALADSSATIVTLPIDVSDTRDGIHLAAGGFFKWHETIKPLMRRHC